ncbi:hypothetical protein [Nocardioides zhouii]|uniref:Glycosyltransferase RgtA/B/C/D-like domain-containing protein n=1 Tax=Nocardioides zhouii TaxID=1168729 RepID=A0A4Q2T1Y0_9ACTN|nr:hypothetical protein [Nocardioides zhouii]RYC12655.1 hypothetical protein EUA94_08310 [Nocardioides zhouii]
MRRAAVWLLSVVVGLVLLHVLLDPLYGPYRWSRTYVFLAAALCAVALPALALGVRRAVPWLEQHPWARRALVCGNAAALVVVQYAVGHAIAIPPGFDAGIVHTIAGTFALELPLGVGLSDYMAAYPNNWLLISVLAHWYDVWLALGGQDVLTAAVVLNAVALTVSVCLTYLAARRMARPATAYVLLGLSWLFIGLSPWVAVPYSDTLAMPFTALVLFLFSLERAEGAAPWRRALLWAAMAATGLIGYQVKPTAIFVLGAVALVAVVAGRRPSRSTLRAGAAYAGAALAGILVASAAVSYAVDGVEGRAASSEVEPSFRLDASHFLKMGAQSSPGPYNDYYGVYDEDDIAETRTLEPGLGRTRFNVERYLERVADMGPVGYPEFLWDKAAWFVGDGSFFMWGEGGMVLDPMPWTATDPVSRQVQDWFFLGGDLWPALFTTWQGAWIVVLLLLALTPLARRDDVDGPVPAAARISVLMLIAFLLLFEARARYVVLYLPHILLVAALTLDSLTGRVAERVRRARGTTAD